MCFKSLYEASCGSCGVALFGVSRIKVLQDLVQQQQVLSSCGYCEILLGPLAWRSWSRPRSFTGGYPNEMLSEAFAWSCTDSCEKLIKGSWQDPTGDLICHCSIATVAFTVYIDFLPPKLLVVSCPCCSGSVRWPLCQPSESQSCLARGSGLVSMALLASAAFVSGLSQPLPLPQRFSASQWNHENLLWHHSLLVWRFLFFTCRVRGPIDFITVTSNSSRLFFSLNSELQILLECTTGP